MDERETNTSKLSFKQSVSKHAIEEVMAHLTKRQQDEMISDLRRGLRRGYYTELVTDTENMRQEEMPGAMKRTKLIWQVRTQQHAPILINLEPPLKPFFLAPAERWTSYKEEKQIVSKILLSTHMIFVRNFGIYNSIENVDI